MALNIQRGRDHGVPDYNSARRAYDLPEVKHVSHFSRVDASVCCKIKSILRICVAVRQK